MQNKEQPPFGVSSQDEELEMVLVRNIVHTFQGVRVEVAISVLIRVLETFLVGLATSKPQGIEFVRTTLRHLRKQISSKKDEEFGFLRDDPNDNDPILYNPSED